VLECFRKDKTAAKPEKNKSQAKMGTKAKLQAQNNILRFGKTKIRIRLVKQY
jgi:hypothetical protein